MADQVAHQTGALLDRAVFESDLVRIGIFRCPVNHPSFEDTGPTETYCFVFPRNTHWILQEGRAPFVADPNTVSLYNAGHPYRRRRISQSGDNSDWFALQPDLLRDILQHLDSKAADSDAPFRVPMARADAGHYLRQRRLLRYVMSTPVVDRFLVDELVIQLLTDILKAAYASEFGPHDDARQHRLVDRVRERFAETTSPCESLPDLAREVGASVFHLCRVFKRHTGFTLHQYRTHLRLRESLEMLEQTPGDILAAALTFGFAGHSHYTRTFKASFGVPPSHFVRDAVEPSRQRSAGGVWPGKVAWKDLTG